MGRIITVASQKGGVGKTTTALNLGYSLSRFGGGVLVVDGDPQASLGIATNLKDQTALGLVDVLLGRAAASDLVVPTKDGMMAFVGMGRVDPRELPGVEAAAKSGALGALVRELGRPYAYTLVDAPAGSSATTMGLLGASDAVILPIQPRTLALKTVSSFLRVIQWTRRNGNPDLRLAGLLVTMFDATRRSQTAAFEEIQASFPPEALFRTAIPVDDAFEEAALRGLPVWLLPGAVEAARSYMDLALELKSREMEDVLQDGAPAGLF